MTIDQLITDLSDTDKCGDASYAARHSLVVDDLSEHDRQRLERALSSMPAPNSDPMLGARFVEQ